MLLWTFPGTSVAHVQDVDMNFLLGYRVNKGTALIDKARLFSQVVVPACVPVPAVTHYRPTLFLPIEWV